MLFYVFLLSSEVVSYDEVVKQLEADLVDYSSSIGFRGSRFRPAQFPEGLRVTVKVNNMLVLIIYFHSYIILMAY